MSCVIQTPQASGIGGSTGNADNAILRADGTGGATLQAAAPKIDDAGNINLVGGLLTFGNGVGPVLKNSGNTKIQLLNSDANGFLAFQSGPISIIGIPTSASGLASGDIYSNAGILTIVP